MGQLCGRYALEYMKAVMAHKDDAEVSALGGAVRV
jgi:hypothetical protein